MHEEFQRAGFYRMFMPRRYGGLEVTVPTFMRVIVEIARGCPSTAWCLALASNHALMVGSWFPQEAQDEVFAGGRFTCASVAAPISEPALKVDGGWELNGKVGYCSGIPYSTYFMGQALTAGDESGTPGPMLLFVAPKGTWRMLDDWGDILGFKGSGSPEHRLRGRPDPRSLRARGDVDDQRRRREGDAGRRRCTATRCTAGVRSGSSRCAWRR